MSGTSWLLKSPGALTTPRSGRLFRTACRLGSVGQIGGGGARQGQRSTRPVSRSAGEPAGRRDHQLLPHACGVQAEHVEPAQHPLGQHGIGRVRRPGRSTARRPSATVAPAVERLARGRRGRRHRACRGRPTGRARPLRASSAHGHVGGARVHPRLGAGLGDRAEHPLEGAPTPRADAPCGAGRSRTRSAPAPASTAGSAGSSTCTINALDAGHPAAQVGDVVADALGQRLRQLAPGAVVGEHLVAARLLDGRGEGPGSGRPGS